jgi:hypothetical protein
MVESPRTKTRVAAHLAALRRYNDWEAQHPIEMEASAALSAVGLLYDLMPPESRHRPSDPSGVAAMHRALATMKVRS